VVHSYNLRRLRQEDTEFEASLGYSKTLSQKLESLRRWSNGTHTLPASSRKPPKKKVPIKVVTIEDPELSVLFR
jgi:hypothetical protein